MKRKKRKKWIVVLSAACACIVCYILVGMWIARDVRSIVESGMRNDTSYRSYMSEQVYDKLNPARRGGMPNYDSSYKPEHHAYGYVVPFHVFFRCEAATRHIFKNASMGYDEMIWIQLKLKNWRWVAADVHIKA